MWGYQRELPFCLGRSPHGERGLKFSIKYSMRVLPLSLPTRGAWIEILLFSFVLDEIAGSLPTRGAWIEILTQDTTDLSLNVAPHTGSVD